MNANLIFNWLKDPRFQPDTAEAEEAVFLPVEVSSTDKRTLSAVILFPALCGAEGPSETQTTQPPEPKMEWACPGSCGFNESEPRHPRFEFTGKGKQGKGKDSGRDEK